VHHTPAPSVHHTPAPSVHHTPAPSEHGGAPSEHGGAPSEHGGAPSEHGGAPSEHGEEHPPHGEEHPPHGEEHPPHGEEHPPHGEEVQPEHEEAGAPFNADITNIPHDIEEEDFPEIDETNIPDISTMPEVQIVKGYTLFNEAQENDYMQKLVETNPEMAEKRQQKIDMFQDPTRTNKYRPAPNVIKQYNLGFYVRLYNRQYWNQITLA
jgi:hypothetical protein